MEDTSTGAKLDTFMVGAFRWEFVLKLTQSQEDKEGTKFKIGSGRGRD